MSFLFPNFLFLLSALTIPIIIHLFNFRRYKKIAFTNVKMLRDIEIKSKSVKQLKNYLILACRILALSFLIFAFAQPFIPLTEESSVQKHRAVAVYIDNSFSLNDGAGGQSNMIKSKTIVSELVNSLNNSMRLYVLSNDFKQSELNPITKNEALNYISDLEVSYNSRSFNEISNRLEVILSEGKEPAINAYLISDFQKSQFPSFNVDLDSNVSLTMIKLEEIQIGNVAIDSCWLSSQSVNLSNSDSLYVSLVNFSDDDLENHPIRVYINDQQVSLNSVDVKAFDRKIICLPLNIDNNGFYNCRINTTDNGIEEDNTLYFSLLKDSLIKIYHLGNEEMDRFFGAVYRLSGEYRSSSSRNADIDYLSRANTFIINGQSDLSSGLIGELENKVTNGSNLILYSKDSSNVNGLNTLLNAFNLEKINDVVKEESDISKINISSNILRNAIERMPENPIFPTSKMHFKLSENARLSKEDLLSFENNDAALRKYEVGEGNVFLYTFPFSEDQSNFVKHPLFVALSINAAAYKRYASQLYYVLGEKNLIPLVAENERSEIIHVQSKDVDVIPELKHIGNKTFIQLHEQVEKANNYMITNSEAQIDLFSLNYSRKESDPRVYTEEEMNDIIEENGNRFRLFNNAKDNISVSSLMGNPSHFLWKYCIILALMFFLAETLIIKFMKT